MLLRGAKLLAASARRLDPVWVDRVVALLLVVVAEMEAWLSHGAGNRLATAVGGAIVSGAVAIRRRWPLGALLTGVGAVIAQDALDGSLTRTGFAAVIPGLLLFYGAGAFLSESRARRALSVGLALISVDAFIPTVMLENLFWVNVLFAALPWS